MIEKNYLVKNTFITGMGLKTVENCMNAGRPFYMHIHLNITDWQRDDGYIEIRFNVPEDRLAELEDHMTFYLEEHIASEN